MTSRVLFVMPPEPGHFFPALAVACRLRPMGAEPWFLTSRSLGELAAEHGVGYYPLIADPALEPSVFVSGQGYWYAFSRAQGAPRQTALADRIRRAVDTLGIGTVVADRLVVMNYGVAPRALNRPALWILLSATLPNWDSPVDYPLPTIVLCPAEFEIPAAFRRHPLVCYAEPAVHRGVGLAPATALGPEVATIAVSFGTQCALQDGFAARCAAVAAAANSNPDCRFLLDASAAQAGGVLDGTCQGARNLHLVRAPLRDILSRAALFVTHGGLGSLKEAILAGVPTLVCPEHQDQPFNAMRVRYHGLGEAIFPEALSPASMSYSIRRMLSARDGYCRRLQAFSALFRQREAAPSAAQLILRGAIGVTP